MDFEKFPKLTRFSQGWTITEKLDGTNAQIALVPCLNDADQDGIKGALLYVHNSIEDRNYAVFAGSRNRWLSLDKDNHGFAKFVYENAVELVKLGPGRHYGEWYGSSIQRGYGLKNGEKRFALFNTLRWEGNPDLPECCEVVHSFISNEYLEDPHRAAFNLMDALKRYGSFHVPGYDNPEGLVMFHRKSGVAFKKTFDYDEEGKWMQNKNVH